jgi:hypothetical protein
MSIGGLKASCCFLIFLFPLLNASGQGFENLDFECTTITPVNVNNGTIYSATIPDWIWTGPYFDNGNTNLVQLDGLSLDGDWVSLQDSSSSLAPAIQGMYSVLLQGGDEGEDYPFHGVSISQTAQIPAWANSILFWAVDGNSLQVTFNGNPVSFNAIGGSANYTIYGASISAYAGQTGALTFTAPNTHTNYNSFITLDEIQFSGSLVPEPSVLSLSAVCFLLFCWRMKLRSKIFR